MAEAPGRPRLLAGAQEFADHANVGFDFADLEDLIFEPALLQGADANLVAVVALAVDIQQRDFEDATDLRVVRVDFVRALQGWRTLFRGGGLFAVNRGK